MQIHCKELTAAQRILLEKTYDMAFPGQFEILDDVVVVNHQSSREYQNLDRRGYIYTRWHTHEEDGSYNGPYVVVVHKVFKKPRKV